MADVISAEECRRYVELCEFVQRVAAALKAHGANVVDLIDAQSFIWTSFLSAKESAPVPEKEKSGKEKTKVVDVKQIAKDLSEAAYWPLERVEDLISLVQKWGQVLFQGPPGTSKTFVAETMSRLLVGGDEEGRVEVVQFRPSYAYEDFVEGIRPRVTEGSDLAYEVRKGIFMRLAQRGCAALEPR
jgi:5-methylcytosine-specific restriction enzyme B